MPKSSPKAERVVKKRLADGTIKEYRYGPREFKPHQADPNSVAALVVSYKLSPEWTKLAATTRRTMTVYIKDLEMLAASAVCDITRRHILSMRDAIAMQRGNGAANNFSRACSAVFGWAVDREWIAHSPAHRIKLLPLGTLPTWTPQQASDALDKLPEHLRRAVVFALYTAQRRSDLVRLTWGDYDGQTIRLRQQKTGRVLGLPVNAEMRAELDAWRQQATAVTILTDAQGRSWDAHRLTETFAHELGKIGLDGLGIHGLRKLRLTLLAQAGCSPHELQAWSGHRTLRMLTVYTDAVDQERLAIAAILRFETDENKLSKPERNVLK